MIDPKTLPAPRRVYRCLVCYATHDAATRPPERVQVMNPDRDETTLALVCPPCGQILDDQARVDAARALRRQETDDDES